MRSCWPLTLARRRSCALPPVLGRTRQGPRPPTPAPGSTSSANLADDLVEELPAADELGHEVVFAPVVHEILEANNVVVLELRPAAGPVRGGEEDPTGATCRALRWPTGLKMALARTFRKILTSSTSAFMSSSVSFFFWMTLTAKRAASRLRVHSYTTA